jgi:hypothetical protein
VSDTLTGTVKSGRDSRLAHPEGARSFAIREADHVDRDKGVAEPSGSTEMAAYISAASALASALTARRSSINSS